METLRWVDDPEAATVRAVSVFRSGGLVVYPTETFYGLGVRALDGRARQRLMEAKGRESEKALPLIAFDVTQVNAIAVLGPGARETVGRLADRFWPGPLTLVLPTAPEVEALLGPSVAVRVSSHPVALALTERLGEPIVSTSANISGQAANTDASEVRACFQHLADLLIDGGRTKGGMPSTLVSLMEPEPRLLRAGAVPEADIWPVIRGSG